MEILSSFQSGKKIILLNNPRPPQKNKMFLRKTKIYILKVRQTKQKRKIKRKGNESFV